MRWQQLDVLPPLDTLVLIWCEEGPVLARRVEADNNLGWHWQFQEERDDYSGQAGWVTVSPTYPLRWAVITPPILP